METMTKRLKFYAEDIVGLQDYVAANALVDRGTVVLSSGVLDASAGPGLYTVASESGSTDQLDQIIGLSKPEEIKIQADTGDTITVADGTYLDLPDVNFTMKDEGVMELMCTATGVCKELGRSSNK